MIFLIKYDQVIYRRNRDGSGYPFIRPCRGTEIDFIMDSIEETAGPFSGMGKGLFLQRRNQTNLFSMDVKRSHSQDFYRWGIFRYDQRSSRLYGNQIARSPIFISDLSGPKNNTGVQSDQ